MTKREKTLLVILFFLIVFCFFFFSFQNSLVQIKETKESIAKYTKMMENLKSKKIPLNDANTIQIEDNILEETTVSVIADEIIRDLKKVGITPIKYQISKDKRSEFIEFSIVCDNTQFTQYLNSYKGDVYPYKITYLNLKNETDRINCTIRYSSIPSIIIKNEKNNIAEIKNLFRPVSKKQTFQEKQTIVNKKEEEIIMINQNYNIIGKIKESDGIDYLYIKNKNNNKVIKIAPEDIISSNDEEVIVIINNEKNLIKKVN